jgi:hypothetical protein
MAAAVAGMSWVGFRVIIFNRHGTKSPTLQINNLLNGQLTNIIPASYVHEYIQYIVVLANHPLIFIYQTFTRLANHPLTMQKLD